MIDDKIKVLAKETILYALNNILIQGCSYIVLLLQINVLTPSEYGRVTECYGTYIAFLGIFYLLSMDLAYFRFVDQLGKIATFNSILTILCMTSLLFSTIILFFLPKIVQITHYEAYIHYFYYIIGIVILDTCLVIPYATLRAEQRLYKLTLIKLAQASASILGTFLLLYHPACLRYVAYLMDYCFHIVVQLNALDGIFIANIVANLTALMLLLPTFKTIRLSWDRTVVCRILGYAAPSFFSILLLRINEILPRSLFRLLIPDDFYISYTKEEMLGNLGISYKLTLVATLAIKAFQYAAEPFFFAHSKNKDAKNLYSQTMYIFTLVASIGLLLFSLNIDWITKLFIRNPLYHHTIDTIPYLTCIPIILGMYYNLSVSFKLANKTVYNSLISGCGSLVIGGLSLLLLPIYGHWGCVYASLIGSTTMVLLGYFCAQKCYPIPYRKHGFLLFLATFLLIDKVFNWPKRITFLPVIWRYIVLNLLMMGIISLIVVIWHRIAFAVRKDKI